MAGTDKPLVTPEDVERSPAFAQFLGNFAKHCGASRAVFVGQLAAALSEWMLAALPAAADPEPEPPVEGQFSRCPICNVMFVMGADHQCRSAWGQ